LQMAGSMTIRPSRNSKRSLDMAVIQDVWVSSGSHSLGGNQVIDFVYVIRLYRSNPEMN